MGTLTLPVFCNGLCCLFNIMWQLACSYSYRIFLAMAVPQVDKKVLGELEVMGFPAVRSIRALHYSGTSVSNELRR